MADINKKYNIEEPDINPFAGTNLDEANKNTRGDTSEESYNTYKNTVYTYKTVGTDTGWFPEETVTGSGYPTSQRSQIETATTIKIFQKEGIGSSVNTTSVNAHTTRNNDSAAKKVIPKDFNSSNVAATNLNKGEEGAFDDNMNLIITSPNQNTYRGSDIQQIEYTLNDGVDKNEINHGNWDSTHYSAYEGEFDTNMNSITNSNNQINSRNYTLNKDPDKDKFTDISAEVSDESKITGKKDTKTDKIDITLGGAIIEAGNHFNRGNDTTVATEVDDPKNPESKITTGIDVNSSRVLDMSMYLNSFKSDILELRGGTGIEVTGKYPIPTTTTES